jgi:predicted nucleic acid-binding protein
VAPRDAVLVDTCVWVPFFNRPQSAEKHIIDGLLDDDRVALIGPVLAEILIGFRRDEHAEWIASLLRRLHWLDVSWDAWRGAARLGRKLKAAGHTLPLSDLALAAVALEQNIQIYSTDPHFDLITTVKRYTP